MLSLDECPAISQSINQARAVPAAAFTGAAPTDRHGRLLTDHAGRRPLAPEQGAYWAPVIVGTKS